MKKVVYNGEFGEFGLSAHALAMLVLARFPLRSHLLALTRYGEADFTLAGPHGLRAHPQRALVLFDGRVYDDSALKTLDAEGMALRSHPTLVSVVELLGPAANGPLATLRVQALAAGAPYRITDFDGLETVDVLSTAQYVQGHAFERVSLSSAEFANGTLPAQLC